MGTIGADIAIGGTLTRLALVIAFASGCSAVCAQTIPSNVVDQMRKSTVFISVNEVDRNTGALLHSIGSGFVVQKDGYVLTAAHLVPTNSDSTVSVSGAMQSKFATLEPMEVVARDPSFDFILLKFRNTAIGREPVRFGSTTAPKEGDALAAVGFPLGLDFGVKFGTLVSRGGPGGAWVLNIAVNPGDGGGPVFTLDGYVIAMVTGALNGAEGIKFALPITHAIYLLRIANVESQVPR